ncbi:NAD(P)/FAD-dependent oxidoreductase [Caldimonas brevitalea]|uniref:FAD-dependent oxidoreductase n=1 Tax=Caldimonas brevitalea TaxID=413882 RepID=A0A0G3BJP0_9BURK|nr:FAD-binding oxidoreductase [Caldimonas brevitalea]AKJ29674.1 FAD-dependent oxidoreductase [Caldimonas brevitalea]
MRILHTDLDLARDSYYAATAPQGARQPPLQGELAVDVAVIGAGLAGLSAALELAERGLQVALLEAHEVGYGASGRNGGQAIAGLACELSTIEAQLGLADARRVFGMTLEALDLLHERCRRYGIDCEWQPGFLNVAVNARKARALRATHDRLQVVYGDAYAAASQWVAPADLPRWIVSPRYHSAVHDGRSGHLHPLKYCRGLARAAVERGVRLHEGTPVVRLEHGPQPRLHTPEGSVRCEQVLLAGNVYLQGVAPQLAARIMPVATYLVGTRRVAPARLKALLPTEAAVCDTNVVLDYFRPTRDGRVLFGGGVSYSRRTPRSVADKLRRRLVATFPSLQDVEVEYAWGGFVDITMNRAPDFGRLRADGAPGASRSSNVYYVQGFSGHGLALTGLAGRLVAEAMAGDAGRFDTFARLRHRAFPGGSYLRTPALVLAMAYYRLLDLW